MIIDQSEIDALLAEADGLKAEAAQEAPPADTGTSSASPGTSGGGGGTTSTTQERPLKVSDPHLKRLLRIRVPVIVQLARRSMSIHGVRDLSVGAIIEFDKSVDEQLDLLVNNRLIGHGNCVKVGENFGLRVTEIRSQADRIRSLGNE